jgi:predicted nuclease of predicted toxin-antitoxin system
MKVLLDSCVCGGVHADLVRAGIDTIWAGDWDEDPGDDEILARAHAEGRVLITLDKDFGEIAIVHGRAHAGIVRIVNFSAQDQGKACLHVLAKHGDELQAGGIVTVQPGRVRIRPHDQ